MFDSRPTDRHKVCFKDVLKRHMTSFGISPVAVKLHANAVTGVLLFHTAKTNPLKAR